MSPLDRHLTTEQLSALLDKQLSPEESEEGYQAHLQTCEQCRQELAGLRQTVNLLQALPEPPLPRSFALPVALSQAASASIIEVSEPQEQTSKTVAPDEIRRVGRLTLVPVPRKRMRTTMRLISSLVAVIGICFVLIGLGRFTSSLSLSHGVVTSAATTNSSQNQPSGGSATSKSVQGYGSPHEVLTPATIPHATATTVVKPNQHADAGNETPSGILSIFSFFDIRTAGGIFRLGLLCLVLGGIGYFLFRQSNTRYRPQ